MILTDTKITNRAYCQSRMEHDVVCLLMSMTVADGMQGGVCLVVQDQPQGWSIDVARFHGTNVVSCKVITEVQCNLIIGAYLLPYTLEHLLELEEALACFQDQYPIVIGYLSANIGKPQNPRSQQIADLITKSGLMDLLHHFQQRWK